MDVFIIGCEDVKWMIMLSSHGMKLLLAEELMYDSGLIECAEFDWFSVRCLEDAPSFTSHIRPQRRRSIPDMSMFTVCAR